MNKIYKVVWSKTKGCYVVASEFAKTHTKSASTGVKAVATAALTVSLALSITGTASAASWGDEWQPLGKPVEVTNSASTQPTLGDGWIPLPKPTEVSPGTSDLPAKDSGTVKGDTKGATDTWTKGGVKDSTTGASFVSYGNNVAIGRGSDVSGKAIAVSGATIRGIQYGGFAGTRPVGVVSVGAKGAERQIQHVAAGRVTADSTDAVNGSQLYQVRGDINVINNNIKETNVAIVNNDININKTNVAVLANTNNIVAVQNNVTGIKNDIKNINVGIANINANVSENTKNINKAKTTVTSHNGSVDIHTSTNPNGSTNYDLDVSKSINAAKTDITNTVNTSIEKVKATIDKSVDVKIDAAKTNINNNVDLKIKNATKNINNTTINEANILNANITNVKADQLNVKNVNVDADINVKNNITVNQKANLNVANISTANINAVNATTVKTGDINVGDKITINNTGINMNGAQITNVGIAVNKGDVVNLGQVTQLIDNSSTTIKKDLDAKIDVAKTDVKNYVDQSVTKVNADLTDVNKRIDVNTTKITDNSKQIKVNADNIEVNKQNIVKAKTTVTSNDKTVDVKTGTNQDGSTNYDLSIKKGANLDLGNVTVKDITVTNRADVNVANISTANVTNVNATSIKTGDINVGDKVTINDTGIDMHNTQITNVAAGVKDGDVVNVGQLNQNITNVKNQVTGYVDQSINTATTTINKDVDAKIDVAKTDVKNYVDQSVKNVSVDLTDVNNRIDSNTTKIADNSKQIQVNASNIEKNATAITNLDGRVNVNAQGIANNSKQIQVNAGNIEKNATAITNLDSRVNVNAQGIADNSKQIKVNADNIEVNKQNIVKAKTTVTSKDQTVDVTTGTNQDGSTNYDLSIKKGANLDLGNVTVKDITVTNRADVNVANISTANVANVNATSIKTGDINVGDKVTINNTGIDMHNTQITNVAAGVKDGDVVNVGQMNTNIINVKNQVTGYVDQSINTATTTINKDVDAKIDVAKTDVKNYVDQSVKNVSVDLTDVNNRIDANTTNIEKNTTAITNLDGRVTVNEQNIADNSKQIKVNVDKIASNVTNIEKNATAITNLDSRVNVNAQGIADNSKQIKVNADNIEVNKQNIVKAKTTVNSSDKSVTVKEETNADGSTNYNLSVDKTVVQGGDNVTVTGDGSKDHPYVVDLDKNINIDRGGSITIGDTVINKDTVNTKTVNAKTINVERGGSINIGDTIINKDTITTKNIDAKTIAAKVVNAKTVNVDNVAVDKSITVKNGPSITATGIDMHNTQITNVAAGIKDGDVVNVGQMNTNIANVKNQVTNYVDQSINTATTTINKDVDAKIDVAKTDVKNYVDQSVKNVNADLTDVNNRIDANTTKITDNSKQIKVNADNIASNVTNIEKNATAIINLDGRVTVNEQGIADNSKQIKVNADNIEVNKQNIVKAKTTVTSNDQTVDVKTGTNQDGSTNYDLSIKKGANLDLGNVTVKDITVTNRADVNVANISTANVANVNATSIKTGDINVGDKVIINNTGIDMHNTQITNVAAGIKDGDVVNVGQLNQNITNVKNQVTNYVNQSINTATTDINKNVDAKIDVAKTDVKNYVDQSVTKVNADLTDVNSRIDANTTNIEKNTTAITNLDGRVSVNEQNIANNSKQIKVNADNIEVNKQNIVKAKTTVTSNDQTVDVTTGTNQDGSTNYDLSIKKGANLNLGDVTVNNINIAKEATINVANINTANIANVNATSIKTGDIVVGDKVTINNTGIDMRGAKITNVAMAVEDNDVVNLKQVNNIKAEINTNIDNRITNVNNTINVIKNDVTNIQADVDAKIINVEKGISAAKTTISSDNNTVAVTSTTQDDGSTKYDLSVDMSGAKTYVEAGNNINVDGDGSKANPYIVNLNNKIDLGNTGSIKFGGHGPSITVEGIDAGNTQITGVKAGVSNTDAVNVAQLNKVVTDNAVKVNSTDKSVNVAYNDATHTYDLSVDMSNVGSGKTHLADGQGTTVTGDGSENNPYHVNIGDTINIGAKDGADGKDGKDGSIAVNGKDGSSVVINGKDGSIGLAGKDGKDAATISTINGKPGLDGKDGMTRIVYKDEAGVDHQVATMDDGMKYGGDTGKVIAKHLNEQVNVVGGIKDATKLTTEANIGVVADGENNLTLKLAKDLTGLSSVTTSNGTSTSILNGDGLQITKGNTNISLTAGGLNMGGQKITGLQAGVSDDEAVNVSQLRSATHIVGDKIRNITETISNVSTAANANRTEISSSDGSIKVVDKADVDANGKNIKHNYDITINNQAVVNNAQIPVVYTDAKGNKVYKQEDGSFNTKADGSGTSIESANVVASMNNGAGSTTTAMQLGNVGSAIAGQTGSDYGIKIDNAIANGAGHNAVNVSDLQANNAYLKNYTDQQVKAAGGGTHYYSVNDGGKAQANYKNDGAAGLNSLAAGVKAVASGEAASAVGHNVTAEGKESFAAGASTQAIGNGSVAIGRNVSATGESSVAIGDGATTHYTRTDSAGKVTELYGNEGIAIGHGAVAAGEKSISIGTGNVVLAKGAVVIGDPTFVDVTANGSINVGNDNNVDKANSILLGSNIKDTVADSAFIGNNSGYIPEISGISLGNKNTGSTVQTVNGVKVNINPTDMGTVGVVSIGSAEVHRDGNGNITAVDLTTRRLQGVANGLVSPTSTDAVTGSQMYFAQEQANQGIARVANDVARVERETRDVGALSAAMAALKPMQYDPLEPTTIMAGVGTYHGSNAVALGLAHYTNESTMINAGVSYASGSNNNLMANAGISWKFGNRSEEAAVADKYRRGPISSTYAMQDEIKAMNEQMAAMQERNNTLEEQVKVLLEKVNKLEAK